jgi:plastocyanin domain-containing protein
MFRSTLIATTTLVLLVATIGCGRATNGNEPKPESAETVIRIEVTETGFEPSNIDLVPDVSAVLEFVRTADQTCVTAVVFHESGIRHELVLNEPLRVTVHPKPGQRLTFACPMDMHQGSFGTADAEFVAPEAVVVEAGGALEIRVDAQGFHPSRIQIAAGQPSVLRFTRVSENTCNTGVLIPSLGIDQAFLLNEPVEVTISPEALDEIAFSCPMEMATGVIEVVSGDDQ